MSKVKKKKEEEKKLLKPLDQHKSFFITQRFTGEEAQMLDDYVEIISKTSGTTVKRSWVVRKLLELGQKALEKEYGIKPKKSEN